MLFVGPKGIGKTCLAKKLARDLGTKKRVCFISLEPYKKEDNEKTLKSIVRRITYFLAAWGDFLFYNKLRMEMDMEEEQWEILWNQIDTEDIIFILDDFHNLPAYSQHSPLVRFFYQFFRKICFGKAKMLIFTQKVPAFPSDGFPTEIIHIPDFEPEEIERLSKSAKFVGFRHSQWPEGHQIVYDKIRKYPGMPILLDFIRSELEYISPDIQHAEKILEIALENKIRNHIQTIYGQLSGEGDGIFDFLEFLQKNPDGFKANWKDLAGQSGFDIETVKRSWVALCCRNFIFPEKEGVDLYMLDNRWRREPLEIRCSKGNRKTP